MSEIRSVNRSLAVPQPNQNLSLDGSPPRPGTPAPPTPWTVPLPLGGNEDPAQSRPELGPLPGQATATEILLGLQLEPTRRGAFPPPPGNEEALRHLTSTARRAILRAILLKRSRLRYLAALLYRDPEEGRGGETVDARDEFSASTNERLKARAHHELAAAAELINLLDHLQEMQDYTLSRIGMFSKG